MGASSSLPKQHTIRKPVWKPVRCGGFLRKSKGVADRVVEDSTTSGLTAEASSTSCGNFTFHLDDRHSTEATRISLPSAEEQIRQYQRRKDLPSTGEFSSCHVMINRERIRLGKKPLYRCIELDTIAQQRAMRMASAQQLNENPVDNETMVENVQKGHSIRIIQQLTMGGVCDSQRDNILSDRFTTFGIGCATGEDGMIYMSQVFHSEETPVSSSSTRTARPRFPTTQRLQSHRSL